MNHTFLTTPVGHLNVLGLILCSQGRGNHQSCFIRFSPAKSMNSTRAGLSVFTEVVEHITPKFGQE